MLLTDVMLYLMKGTLTNIRGVLKGDGKSISEVGIDDSTLTDDNNRIPTSGVVKSAISATYDVRVLANNASLTLTSIAYSACFVATSRSNSEYSSLAFVAGNSVTVLIPAPNINYSLASWTLTVSNSTGDSVNVRILNISRDRLVTFDK